MDRAADQLTRKGTKLKRFGFVTTNSITQEFSRRVIQARMDARPPVSLLMAISDHPWTKATPDTAAVRIAMTVVQAGSAAGRLNEVVHEAGLHTDTPAIETVEKTGMISADLTAGTDVTRTRSLIANQHLASNGMKPLGSGFIVTPAEAEVLGLGKRPGLDKHIRAYRNGRDLASKPRQVMALDFYGLTAEDVRRSYPEAYQHLLTRVKPERDASVLKSNTADAREYADKWWLFCKPRQEMRDFLTGLDRYVVTVQTAKHRIFQFLPRPLMPDQKLMVFGIAEGHELGVLSSRVHVVWTLATCSWLGVGNDSVYVKVRSFDPFPFPDATEDQRARIGDIAEELDATRKDVLAEHPDLTLTTLYNLRDKLLKKEPFTAKEEDQRMRGRVDIIAELHDRLDAAVAEAYGWPADLSDEEIVARLVALNAERAAEEKRGIVRWLRPEYQQKKAGVAVLQTKPEAEQIEALLPVAKAAKPLFPRDAIGQTAAVLADLRSGGVLSAEEIAARYKQGRKVAGRIEATLQALARLGHVAPEPEGYRLRRAA